MELEFEGANAPQLSLYKSKYNPELGISFEISRKDLAGTIAEWAYTSFAKRDWNLLRRQGRGTA